MLIQSYNGYLGTFGKVRLNFRWKLLFASLKEITGHRSPGCGGSSGKKEKKKKNLTGIKNSCYAFWIKKMQKIGHYTFCDHLLQVPNSLLKQCTFRSSTGTFPLLHVRNSLRRFTKNQHLIKYKKTIKYNYEINSLKTACSREQKLIWTSGYINRCK